MGLDAALQGIPHTANSVTIEFTSGLSTPGNDESYAFDNVEVDFRGVPYYQANFDSGLPSEFTVTNFATSTVDSRPRPDLDFLDYGMSGNWLRTTNGGTQTATLTLTDLPGHSFIDLDFLLGTLDSIDSNDGPFEVKVDGETIFSQNFGPGGASYDPGKPISLVRMTQLGGNLGPEDWWRDGVYHMGLLSAFNHIPHNADTLTIEFSSALSSSSGDESYAIDNVSVVLGVPEPSTLVGLVGLVIIGGLGLLWRRR